MAAQPQPPPSYWPPPRPADWRSSGAVAGIVLAVALFFVFVLFTGFFPFPGGLSTMIFAPVCAVVLVVILVLAMVASQGWNRRAIPPPPPIQQPMVPAGTQDPVALSCPNCGAPPQGVDRFGVATCSYCNTRYLVR